MGVIDTLPEIDVDKVILVFFHSNRPYPWAEVPSLCIGLL